MKIIIGIIIAFKLMAIAGNSEYVENYNKEFEQQEQQAEQIVEPTAPVVEQKDKDIVYLEELEAQLEGMNAIEIQQFLGEQGISYELEKLDFYSTWDKDRNPYIYYHWKISVVKGNYEFYADWYDKQGNAEIFTMGVQEVDN